MTRTRDICRCTTLHRSGASLRVPQFEEAASLNLAVPWKRCPPMGERYRWGALTSSNSRYRGREPIRTRTRAGAMPKASDASVFVARERHLRQQQPSASPTMREPVVDQGRLLGRGERLSGEACRAVDQEEDGLLEPIRQRSCGPPRKRRRQPWDSVTRTHAHPVEISW